MSANENSLYKAARFNPGKQSEGKVAENEMVELNRFLKNDKMAEKLSTLGINSEILKEMWKKIGKMMIVSFCCTIRKQKRLPRVSKNMREILTIINGPEDCNWNLVQP